MTNQQSAILEFLGEQPTAAIHGPAGTGKTLLAVEKARSLSRSGHNTLYLCLNEFLLESLRKAILMKEISHFTMYVLLL